jgi:restriction system protein
LAFYQNVLYHLKVQPEKSVIRSDVQKSQAQVAAVKEIICSCGAPMVSKKGKEGKPFFGCSTFPKCGKTRSV